MVYELTRCQEWLYQRLATQPVLGALFGTRIYASPAPQETPKDAFGKILPYVLIDHRAGTDQTAGQGVRIGSQEIFAIEVVTETQSTMSIEGAYDAIDSALQGLSGDHRGMIIDLVARDQNYTDWGVESGSTRRHVGALWRLYVRPQP
jgi:hypothetical protein